MNVQIVMTTPERQLEEELVEKLRGLKYEHRDDIRSRSSLEANFRQKFDALNHVTLTDSEFARLLDEIVTGDVFADQWRGRSNPTGIRRG